MLTDGLLYRDDPGAGGAEYGGDGVAALRGHRGRRSDHHVSGAARANRDELRLALGVVNDRSHLLHRVPSGVDGRHHYVLRLLNGLLLGLQLLLLLRLLRLLLLLLLQRLRLLRLLRLNQVQSRNLTECNSSRI